MYLHLFLLLFGSGAAAYFIPLKETSHLQNETKYSIINEILCLLKAENATINGEFSRPLHIKSQACAHNNTEKFIHELEKISTRKCIKIVEKDMKRLEEKCPILKKSSSSDEKCLEVATTSFLKFKESLEEFLNWVNHKQGCSNMTRSESGLYLDGKCNCADLWSEGSLRPNVCGFWTRICVEVTNNHGNDLA
ncbi:uncharacterized protein VSU04_010332 [Chlamydotis macqueenii]